MVQTCSTTNAQLCCTVEEILSWQNLFFVLKIQIKLLLVFQFNILWSNAWFHEKNLNSNVFWWNTLKSATMEYEIVYGAKLSIWYIEEKLDLSPQYFLDGRWLWKNNRPIWDSCATAFYYRPLISFELMFGLNFRIHFNFVVENIPYVSGYNFLWLF